MKRNSRLTLPEDPNINIWNYYSIMKVTPIIMGTKVGDAGIRTNSTHNEEIQKVSAETKH